MARVTRDGVSEQSVIGYLLSAAACDPPGGYAVDAAVVASRGSMFFQLQLQRLEGG